MDLYEGDVFVVWKWEWRDNCSAAFQDVDVGENEQSNLSDDGGAFEDGELDSITAMVKHSVEFKCIDASRDLRSQEVLSLASRKRNDKKAVRVKLGPEETNPKNARAIAFQCKIDSKWERIGYCIEEVL